MQWDATGCNKCMSRFGGFATLECNLPHEATLFNLFSSLTQNYTVPFPPDVRSWNIKCLYRVNNVCLKSYFNAQIES